ncbi:MAG: hypothetical protein ACYCW6_27800 [Candidatus Xenobia bacterium]
MAARAADPGSAALDRWQTRFVRAARRDGLRWMGETAGYDALSIDLDPSIQEQVTEEAEYLLSSFIEVVTYVLACRRIDNADAVAGFAKRFLAMQVYGAKPFEHGGTYFVRLRSDLLNLSLHADNLSDIDLEDLRNAFGLDHIEISMRTPLMRAAAEEIVEHVRYDLEFDGERFDLTWQLHDDLLEIDVVEITDDNCHE